MSFFKKLKKVATSPFRKVGSTLGRAIKRGSRFTGKVFKGAIRAPGKALKNLTGVTAAQKAADRQVEMLEQQEADFLSSEADEEARRKKRQTNILRSGLTTSPSLFDVLGSNQ